MKFSSPYSACTTRLPRWCAAVILLVGAAAFFGLLLQSPVLVNAIAQQEASPASSSPATTSESENEAKAVKFYDNKSYAQAAELYARQLAEEKPRKQTERWRELTYRVYDARLRAFGRNTPTNQQAQLQEAIAALTLLTTGAQPVEEDTAATPSAAAPSSVPASPRAVAPGRGRRPLPPPIPRPTPTNVAPNMDLWAALANESLGDFYLKSVYGYSYMHSQPYNHFNAARAWWAEQEQSEEARAAWLRLYFKPLRSQRSDFYINNLQWVPAEAETAVRLATGKFDFATKQTAADTAAAHYTYVVSLMRGNANNPALRKRLLESVEPALSLGKQSGWNDDLLFSLAQFYQNYGELQEIAPGQYRVRPDFVTALKYYRRLTSEFAKGDSQFYDQAQNAIKEISEPSVEMGQNVAGFQPGSLIRFSFNTRNVTKATMSLRKLNLPTALDFSGVESHNDTPAKRRAAMAKGIGEEVRSWTVEPKPEVPHQPTYESQTTEPLPPGAYWLDITAAGASDNAMIFVTNTAVTTVQGGGEKIVAYVTDATTGLPKANAEVTVLRYVARDSWSGRRNALSTRTATGRTNENGTAEITVPQAGSDESERHVSVVAMADDQPAACMQQYFYHYSHSPTESRAYVYTDSPAYKPGNTVKFRVIYRENKGDGYSTPVNQRMTMEVRNPQGEKLLEKEYELGEFGSFAGDFAIPKDAPLGSYMVTLRAGDASNSDKFYHSAELFRIEEFKLPEFRVEVKVPEKDGKPVIYRPGDKVKAEVKVTYYSGGVVANGDVEFDISQNVYYGDNPWPEPYPWYYQGIQSTNPWMRYYRDDFNQRGQNIIKRGNVKTDDKGVAYVEFDTPATLGQTMQYDIAVRASDASRRVINGSGSVKVSPAPFFIHLKPDSRVYAPGTTARIEGRAVDANGKPVEMKGTLTLTRKRWVHKVAKNKEGKIVRTVFNGYDDKEMERRDIATDKEGNFKVSVPVAEEGWYEVAVVSPPFDAKASATGDQNLVERARGEANFFAASNASNWIGYRTGGLQIIPDKVTYRVGDTARLIILAPKGGGAALVSLCGQDLLSYQVVRMDGAAKLVEIPVTQALQPNALIAAAMIRDGQLNAAQEEIIVPPDEHFLNFDLKPEQTELRPGAKSAWTVQVTDREGKPVRAEVSLGVVDAAIYYIQQDLAGDIRQFFYGEKRSFRYQVASSVSELTLEKIEKPAPEEDVTIVEVTDAEVVAMGGKGQPMEENAFGDSSEFKRDRRKSAPGGRSDLEGGSANMAYLPAPPAPASPAAEPQTAAAYTPAARAVSRPRSAAKAKNGADKDSMLAAESAPLDELAKEGTDAPDQPLTVRSDFRVSAFWDAAVKTDAHGKARLEVAYPETLTEWKAIARGVTTKAQFGSGDAVVKTAQPLMVRLQTPRFVVEGDKFTLTSVINNETDKPVTVKTKIEAKNLETIKAAPATVVVEPRVQAKAEAEFEAKLPGGTAEITASGTSPAGSDGMRLPLPIVEHGIEKFIARSFVLDVAKGDAKIPATTEANFTLNVPEKRNPGTTRLDFVITPSLASTCLDALPYLADYPYGCVEQTMSRFLPACVASRTLRDLKLDPEYVAGRLFGGVEPAYATAMKVKKGDLTKLDDMTKKGLARLADFQHGDGGWGWWKDDTTNDYMTAYVVQGLALAKRAGVDVPDAMMHRGAEYLKNRLVQYKNDPDNAAWLLYAIALSSPTWEQKCERAAKLAYDNRQDLSAFSRSLLALALWEKRPPAGGQYEEWAKTLIQNLENGVQEVKAESDLIGKAGSATMPTTCFWGEPAHTWRWRDGSIESTAMALRAMLAIDPQNKRVDQAARWLINNRRGAQWKNTRDTAMTILSMLDYIRTTREGAPDLTVEVLVNGEVAEKLTIGKEEALGTLPINVPESKLKTGENKVTVKLSGQGRLYASAYLRYFTKEVPITAAGNEIYVKREYFRENSVPRLIQGITTRMEALKDGDEVQSGDKITVKLTLEAKNDYEYLVFEDKKPAGFEAVQIRSGEPAYARQDTGDGKFQGPSTWMNQELRDQHVAFFITKLPNGKHQISYELRAETPGRFHGLPTLGHAMYVPEIRCNSDEFRVTVKDKATP